MKILVIFTCPFCNDGISNNVMNYFKYIDHNKINADFLVNNIDVPEKWVELIKDYKGKLFVIKNRKMHPLSYQKKLTNLIIKNKYDIVHAHGNSATLYIEMSAARNAKVPIRIAHSRNTKCNFVFLDKLLRNKFYSSYTNAFACGKDAGEWLFPKREYQVIKNGNDITKNSFDNGIRNCYRNEFQISDDTVVLIHVGFFVNQKNHNFLINVFYNLQRRGHRKYKLLLVGTGKLAKKINRKIIRLKLEDDVILLGNRDDVPNLLSMSDCFVFPSKFEGLPNALIEAQISGLSCFVSNRISKEASITENVKFLPIEGRNSINTWFTAIENNIIENREKQKDTIVNNVRTRGFDIEQNARVLEKKYIDLYNQKQS